MPEHHLSPPPPREASRTPERFMGKTWRDLRLYEQFYCRVVAIIPPEHEPKSGESVPANLLIPSPDIELGADDSLIVLGLAKDIEQMAT